MAEKKRLEQEVTSEEVTSEEGAHLAAIVACSDDAIISKTLDGIIKSWNTSAERIFGYPAEEAIGRPITLIIPQDRLAEERRILETLKRGERIDHFETVRRAKDGRLIDISLTVSPVRNAAGVVTGASKIARDISERKRAEAALREREEALSRANAELHRQSLQLQGADRQKDEFLAVVAHELRNPLAPIRTAAEFLAQALPDEPKIQSALGAIRRQTTLLKRLVDDLTEISRITEGRVQLLRGPLDIATVVAQAVETVQAQMKAKGHKLYVASPSYEPLYVKADLGRLVQCLVNVLVNAAKYTEPHGQIRLETRAEEGCVVIEVTDNGCGISPEMLPRIFDLFVQSDRTLDRAQGGLGIGLALVKRLVEMQDGTVHVRSPGIGLGTMVQFRLPRIDPPQRIDLPQRNEPVAESHSTIPRRILIVDDNVDAAQSLALLLEFRGHDVTISYTAHDALERIESIAPEVALLDLGLPGMSGFELAGRLRARPELATLRLVALTGHGQAEQRQRTQAAGFDDHLVKPVELIALERAISGPPRRL